MPRSTAVVGFAVTVAALSMLAAGCGASPGTHVAQVGSTTTATQNSTPSTGAATSQSLTSQTLAYVHCMRSHGVLDFPDPTSSGQIPKAEVLDAKQANPSQFDSAERTCGHLLPSGGNGEPPAEIAQDWSHFRAFARCMRHHGVPNWPDPSSRSATDRRPTFDLTASGLNLSSPQLRATAQQCAAPLHRAGLPADASLIP
jgi:hypothetical protein